ncbi:hypothetical protein CJP72_24470 [Citrobacter sp. NCU1]|nr:hypothetical protein [Citrobacter sp. NCU1]
MGILGAVSVDLTYTKSDRAAITGDDKEGIDSGQSWRARYSKTIAETDSTLAVSALHNTSGGYWSFSDAYALRSEEDEDDDDITITDDGVVTTTVVSGRTRNELQRSLTQRLGDTFGSVGLSASKKTFHDRDGEQTSVSINWNTPLKGIGLSLGYVWIKLAMK